MAIELGDNIQTGAPKPTDSRYLNNQVPWASCAEVNAGITDTRYTGLTVNILGSEYWYKDGILDACLIEKTSGGGSSNLAWTGSTANAIGTYMSVSGICAQPNLTFDGSILSVTGAATTTTPATACNDTTVATTAFVKAQNYTSCAGTVTSVAALTITTTGTDITSSVANGTTTPVITLCIPTASATNRGALSSTDWSTFNAKTTCVGTVTGTGTANELSYWSSTTGIGTLAVATYPSLTEISYVKGVSSAIQTQIGNKANTANPTFTGTVTTPVIKITTGAAIGCVLTSGSDGTASWSTPAGGGIAWTGSTANGIGTYSSSGTICSEPNLTFDGSILAVTGSICASSDIEFCNNANKFISIDSGTGTVRYLTIQGMTKTNDGSIGGHVYVRGGWGYGEASAGAGGDVIICGGSVSGDYTPNGAGGDVSICGANGVNTGDGGIVTIKGGCAGGACTDGTVSIYNGADLKLATTTYGTCTTGCACVTGIICSTTCVSTPIVCNPAGSCLTLAGATGTAIYASTTMGACITSTIVYLNYAGANKLCTVTNGICLGTQCGFATDWVATSDRRLKENIQPISTALSIIENLCGVCYNLCDDETKENRIGLIAQDVEKVLPEIVSHSAVNEEDLKYGITDEKLGLKYDKLTAVLVEAVKELKSQNVCLQNQIIELRKKI